MLLFSWFSCSLQEAQTILAQQFFLPFILLILGHFLAWLLHKLVDNY